MDLFNLPIEEHKGVTSVSPELLRFLEWLFEHEQDTLRMLIKKSLRTISPLATLPPGRYDIEDIKDHLGHLCSLLETLVQEGIDSELHQHSMHQLLVPAINH